MYYVNMNHANASDTLLDGSYNNGYPGDATHPARPRATIPYTRDHHGIAHLVPPGAYIEIRSGPYVGDFQGNGIVIGGQGTFDEPIFVIANPEGVRATLAKMVTPGGSYIVMQGLHFDHWELGLSAINTDSEYAGYPHHLVFRDCTFTNARDPNDPNDRSPSACIAIQSSSESNPVHNVIVSNCKLGPNGAWTSNEGDEDMAGLVVGANAHDITVMNCEMFNCEGNGVQVNAGCYLRYSLTHNIFIYRNSVHDNKQSSLWSKFAKKVTFLENAVKGARVSNSDPYGVGIGFQYGPEGVLIESNVIEDCANGIVGLSRNGATCGSVLQWWYTAVPDGSPPGPGTGIVIARNQISGITATPSGAPANNGWVIKVARQGAVGLIIEGNEIDSCAGGVCTDGPEYCPVAVLDNEFAGVVHAHVHYDQNLASWCDSSIAGNSVDPPSEPLRVVHVQGTCP